MGIFIFRDLQNGINFNKIWELKLYGESASLNTKSITNSVTRRGENLSHQVMNNQKENQHRTVGGYYSCQKHLMIGIYKG